MKYLPLLIPLLVLIPLGYLAYNCEDIDRYIQVSEDEIIYIWLKAEATNPRQKFAKYYKQNIENVGDIELINPDLTNKIENDKRREVFMNVRGKYLLWSPIYNSTVWYKTTMFITPFTDLLAPYKPEYIEYGLDINNMILWGHSRYDKFVVLEGNHRWHSWLQRYWKFGFVKVYVGLSDQPYVLHAGTGCTKCLLDQTWKGCPCNHTEHK